MPGRATTKRWRCCWGQTWRWMQWTRQDRIKNWSMVVCDPTEIGPVAVNLSWIILAFVPFTWGLPHEIGTGIFLRRRSVLLRSIMRWMAEWTNACGTCCKPKATWSCSTASHGVTECWNEPSLYLGSVTCWEYSEYLYVFIVFTFKSDGEIYLYFVVMGLSIRLD